MSDLLSAILAATRQGIVVRVDYRETGLHVGSGALCVCLRLDDFASEAGFTKLPDHHESEIVKFIQKATHRLLAERDGARERQRLGAT